MTSKQAPPIPRRIKVGDKMYSVDIIQSMQRARDRGRIWYEAGRIQIGQSSNVDGRKYTDIQMSETFWHELVHAILYEMDSPLYRNEKFVHAFATHLAKAIQSAKFK
jgi:hypothetical protein